MGSEKNIQVSRRFFLGGLGCVAASSAMPLAMPTNTSILTEGFVSTPSAEALTEFAEYLFGIDREIAETNSLLKALKNAGSDGLSNNNRVAIAQKIVGHVPLENEMIQGLYGNAASVLEAPSSAIDILKLLDNPAFQETEVYRCFLSQMPRSDAAWHLNELSKMHGDKLDGLVREVFSNHETVLKQLSDLARGDSELLKEIEKQEKIMQDELLAENETVPRAFGNAAAARKAAMYPIPSTIPPEEQEKLAIGRYARPYASSCEHYGTVGNRDEKLRAHYTKS